MITGSSPKPMQASLGHLVGLAARIAEGTHVSDAVKARVYDLTLLELQTQWASLPRAAGQ